MFMERSPSRQTLCGGPCCEFVLRRQITHASEESAFTGARSRLSRPYCISSRLTGGSTNDLPFFGLNQEATRS